MKYLLRSECARALKGKGFLAALCIGFAIILAQIFVDMIPARLYFDSYIVDPDFLEGGVMNVSRLFTSWIGGNRNTMFSFLYFLIVPILSALPFADTFFTDVKDGYIRSVCTRTRKGDYYLAKWVATFLSGGLAVTLPLLFNFYVAAMLFPAVLPQAAAGVSLIDAGSMMPGLYYYHPFVYVFVYMAIIFLFSGILATFSLALSYYVGHRFLVVIAPFVVYLFLWAVASLSGAEPWWPAFFIHPDYAYDAKVPLLTVSAVLLGCSVFGFLLRGRHEDIF